MGSILSILAVLSTLLIFVISWWKVLIINFCVIAILLIFFQDTETSGWVYLAESILGIGIMVLVICFPEKVRGGIMSKSVDYIASCLDVSDKSLTVAELTKRFHISVGIGATIFIFSLAVAGSIFRYKNSKHEICSYSLYLSVPLSCMGGLMLLSAPLHIMMSMSFGIPYGCILTFIALMGALDTGDSDSRGSGGDSYNVIIIKH